MSKPPRPHTPSQTVGPFFHLGLTGPRAVGRIAGPGVEGERIWLTCRVLDGDGAPVNDALIEIWQADAQGRYHHPDDPRSHSGNPEFLGFGRQETGENGSCSFETIKPGAYPWENHPNAWRPAHVHFSLFGHAFATRLVTQMYFPGDPLFPFDPIFNSIPDERARQRLIAQFDFQETEPAWALGYRFDIVLRGREETPFE